MKALIIQVGAGIGLFAGAMFGALAATGRLNHEGTANIPLVSMLFPATEAVAPAGGGKPTEAVGTGGGAAAEAAHTGTGNPQGQEPKSDKPSTLKKGRSLVQPEKPAGEGGHGGGHGEATKDEHGAKKGDHAAGKTDHGKIGRAHV